MDRADDHRPEFASARDTRAILLDAVWHPDRLRPDSVAACARLLMDPGNQPEQNDAALDALNAMVYAGPDLDLSMVVSGVVRALASEASDDPLRVRAADTLQGLLTSSVRGGAEDALRGLIAQTDLSPEVYPFLIDLLEHQQVWHPDWIDPAELVSLAETEWVQSHWPRLVYEVLTPALLGQPEHVTSAMIDRLVTARSDSEALRYLLWWVAGHTLVAPGARAAARTALPEFPLHSLVRERLLRSDVQALIVSNIRDGQGDEILRVAPLAQALLDANPAARVTVVTARPYLFAHPRVELVDIGSAEVLPMVADSRYTVVVNFHEPNVPEVQHRTDLSPALISRQITQPSMLWICMAKGNNENTFQIVDVDGEPWAQRLGLNRPLAWNLHEPAMRLLAELGLPVRMGEVEPLSEPVLAGLPWPDADDAWDRFTAANGTRRPVVLVNPFGGAMPLKGLMQALRLDLTEVSEASNRPSRSWLRTRSPSPRINHSATVLVLTPVKDAESLFPAYVHRLKSLSYPSHLLSLGMLESDSADDTYGAAQRLTARLRRRYRRAQVWKRDFGYTVPTGMHRGHPAIQVERRTVLARSRNHLLFHALQDEDWVLWLDVDVEEYPPDLIEKLLATGKDIVQPHCVLIPGGPTFDTNGWRDAGRLHLDDLRPEGDLVPLDAVGGTVLLVRADLHRDGLVFPAFPYGRETTPRRSGQEAAGEFETEGLGIMAKHMGYQCWGMPHLEVRHANR